jgi:LysM repeat protein
MRKIPAIILVLTLITAFAASAAPVTAQGARTYVVQPGDSMFSIASRFNVSVSELATINRIYDVNAVPVGSVLILPNPLPAGYQPGYPTVPQQPAQPQPAQPQPAPPVRPVVYTPPTVVYPAGTTVTTVTRYSAYTVRAGDTLAKIAARFSTTQQAILSANAIADPNRIFVGQLLTIPRTTTTIVPRPRPVVTTAVGGARRVYIVQPGDNLFSIGARFGRDAWAIARLNGILNLNSIYIGQPLAIP